MKLDIFKIWATGSTQRWMFFVLNGEIHAVRISDWLYCQLKKSGVPTSQSLRGKKHEK